MRRIYIYTGNHLHSAGITDLVMMLRNGARDCGYDAIVSHEPVSDEWNILIENFGDAGEIELIHRKWTPGTRYIVLCTEALTGGYFNGNLVHGHWHYSNQSYWKARFEGFSKLVDLTNDLWVLSNTQLKAYKDAFPKTRVSLLPHGWVSGMRNVTHRPESEKDIDFFFSGTLTPYRLEVLAPLHKRYKVVFAPQHAADYFRMDALARTKVCLSIPLSLENGIPSVSRMHFHIQNANFVLQHQYTMACELDEYVLHAPAHDFPAWAIAALELTNRREIAEAAHTRFKVEMPMLRWMKPLLECSLQQSTSCGLERSGAGNRSLFATQMDELTL